MKKKVLAAALTLFFAVPAAAQSHTAVDLRVGSDVINGALLHEGVETITNSFSRNGETRQGPVSTETLSRVWRDGDQFLKHVSTVVRGEMVLTQDTTYYDAATLAPISHYSAHTGRRTLNLWYGANAVTGSRTAADGTVEDLNIALDRPVYDPSSLLMIVRSLPLEEGFAATIPMFDHENLTTKFTPIWVLGKEWMETSDGRTEAWKVAISHGDLDNPAIYWIGVDSRESLKSTASWDQTTMESSHSYESE